MKKTSGQVLILVLLIVIVSLAVGLSVASRNIVNLRTATQTEHSQRAFTAAEGGVEDVLARLPDVASDIANDTALSGCSVNPASNSALCNVLVGDVDARVTVETKREYKSTIDEGTVGQVQLDGYSGDITVEWIKKGDPLEDISPRASLELTFVCENPQCFGETGGTFSQHRLAFEAEGIAGQVGFSPCALTLPEEEFVCKETIAVAGSDNVKFLRIRPFWNRVTVRVNGVPVGGPLFLPTQTYEVVSLAATELGITRRVQVTRTALPQLPATFDYALFSEEGDIEK